MLEPVAVEDRFHPVREEVRAFIAEQRLAGLLGEDEGGALRGASAAFSPHDRRRDGGSE